MLQRRKEAALKRERTLSDAFSQQVSLFPCSNFHVSWCKLVLPIPTISHVTDEENRQKFLDRQ